MRKHNNQNQENKTTGRSKYFLIVVTLLVITNIFTIAFFTYRNHKIYEQIRDPLSLIDPTRDFTEQKHFIINIEPLRQDLKKLVKDSEPTSIGVYFEVLKTGANISINQDTRFWPASLGKLPVAIAVMKKIENGEWKSDNELVLFEDDKDERYGTLYKKPTGTTFTINELLREMLINSDNTAQNIFIRNTETESFESLLSGLGLEDLFDKKYDITAKEYSRLFRSLYTSSYLEKENSKKLLTIMSESKFDDFLGQGVPDEALFSHKIGEQVEQKTYLDSGIVYVPNRPYLITVMIKLGDGKNKEDAEKIMKEISEKVYDYIKNY